MAKLKIGDRVKYNQGVDIGPGTVLEVFEDEGRCRVQFDSHWHLHPYIGGLDVIKDQEIPELLPMKHIIDPAQLKKGTKLKIMGTSWEGYIVTFIKLEGGWVHITAVHRGKEQPFKVRPNRIESIYASSKEELEASYDREK